MRDKLLSANVNNIIMQYILFYCRYYYIQSNKFYHRRGSKGQWEELSPPITDEICSQVDSRYILFPSLLSKRHRACQTKTTGM